MEIAIRTRCWNCLFSPKLRVFKMRSRCFEIFLCMKWFLRLPIVSFTERSLMRTREATTAPPKYMCTIEIKRLFTWLARKKFLERYIETRWEKKEKVQGSKTWRFKKQASWFPHVDVKILLQFTGLWPNWFFLSRSTWFLAISESK